MIKKTPYRKFIILSSPRSGTHMIRTILRNHYNIAARSELFNPDFLQAMPFGPETPAEEILQEYIFREYPVNVKVVGFIIHRSGTPFGDWPNLWQMLEDDKEIYIISLRRRNLLKRYLSYQVMRTFKGAPPGPLNFDPEDLRNDFIYQQQEIEAFDERFSDHPLLKIYYEDLCNNYNATIKKVQRFLKVKPRKLWPDIKARPKRNLNEAIANFDELQIHFSQTEWSGFFEEEEGVTHVSKPASRPVFFGKHIQFLEYLANSRRIRLYRHIRDRYFMNWSEFFIMLIKNSLSPFYNQLIKNRSVFYKKLPHKSIPYYSEKLEELVIRSFFNDCRKGFFLDVGCAGPIQISTTCYLENHLEWSGIAVDANPSETKAWKKYRPNTQLFKFLVTDHYGSIEKFYAAGGLGSTKKERNFKGKIVRGTEVLVPTITLSKLLDDNGIKKIDFLSMDIEGSEIKALEGFDINRFQPDLVCIEFNRKMRPEILAYFESHQYQLIEEYQQFDKVNRYFRPQ